LEVGAVEKAPESNAYAETVHPEPDVYESMLINKVSASVELRSSAKLFLSTLG